MKATDEQIVVVEKMGAVDLYECYRPCKCEICRVCGYRKHTAVHGPFLGQLPGSKPWGHQFVSKEKTK